jgi:hypothetical protein
MHNYRCYYNCYSHFWWWWLVLAVLWSTQVQAQVVNTDQHDQPPVYAIQIDQAHYVGYISENVHAKDGFVSFVDPIKPSFQVTSLDKVIISQRGHVNPCQQLVNDGYLNITIENKNSNSPFAIDLSEYYDNRCFINIRLASSSSSSLFTLNREETAQYKIVVNLNGYYNAATAIHITINVLDDNDNDPIFENYEYSVDLRQVDIAQWPSLSMRQLIALNSTDADLKRNTFTRFFIDDHVTDTFISKYFLLDYYTGILYTTSTIGNIFDETDVDKSVRINVKAVNLLNDMSYDLTSVIVNLIRYEWSSSDDRVEFRMQVGTLLFS